MFSCRSAVGIVVPCYNEEKRIELRSFEKFLFQNEECFFLFVNDGSTDHTADMLRGFVQKFPLKSSLICLSKNKGKAEAVRQGIMTLPQKCLCDYVGYWDADLATPLEEIPRFLKICAKSTSIKLVAGSRIRRLGADIKRLPIRHYTGRLFATYASIVLGLPVYDTQCGAKLFQLELAKKIFEKPFETRWLFDVEIFARAKRVNGIGSNSKIMMEIPLLHWEDKKGSTIQLMDWIGIIRDGCKLLRLH